jgi:hypothetical protein
MATAHQPITQEILEELHPIIDFSPYSELLSEQDEIGWNQLLLGRYGIKWDQCQRRYLENKHQKPITGEPKWIRNVIRETKSPVVSEKRRTPRNLQWSKLKRSHETSITNTHQHPIHPRNDPLTARPRPIQH